MGKVGMYAGMSTEEKTRNLDELLRQFGISDKLSGFDMLADAVAIWEPGKPMMEIYAYVGQMYARESAAAERCMRHALTRAQNRSGYNAAWKQWFGATINPKTGLVTNHEFVARLGREFK